MKRKNGSRRMWGSSPLIRAQRGSLHYIGTRTTALVAFLFSLFTLHCFAAPPRQCPRSYTGQTTRTRRFRDSFAHSGHPARYNLPGKDASAAKQGLCLECPESHSDATPRRDTTVSTTLGLRFVVARGVPVTPDRLASHLSVNSYGSFTLTDAIRPGAKLPVRPRQGYRVEIFRDRRARLRLPMLSASVSAERLFDTFLALLEPLGE